MNHSGTVLEKRKSFGKASATGLSWQTSKQKRTEKESKIQSWRSDFPVFEGEPDLVFLDSAATTHKPRAVIDAVTNQLAYGNGSPNRGAYQGSVTASRQYMEARESVRRFIGAEKKEEIIFTKNTTEALNLIAYSYAQSHAHQGGNVVVAITSHHSNLVPWQLICKKTGMSLRYLYIDREGQFTEDSLAQINEDTVLVAFPLIANAYGLRHPVEALTELAHRFGAVVVVDGAQAAGHIPIDVKRWSCDFFAFSGHKLYAPQGIGVLYGKKALLETMQPFLSGGDMIEYVTEQNTTFAPLPEKLEAGTQNVTGAVGLKAAIEYLEAIGPENVHTHEKALVSFALNAFRAIPWVRIIGPDTSENRGALIAFTVDGIHPHDVASLLDTKNIAIRAGHHCCQPLMQYLGNSATCRISFGVYSREEDIELLITGLRSIREVFGYVS